MRRVMGLVAGVGIGILLAQGAQAGGPQPRVAVVRSDYGKLDAPVPADQELDLAQTQMVVRAALDALGGMRHFVKPQARSVVIKPNIVKASPPGSGDITDARVVWAVARLVHEANPAARITIAEGPAEFVTPGHPEALGARPEMDGFGLTGYSAILGDPELAGAVELLDLNFAPADSCSGAATGDAYWICRAVRTCDVFIDVPVLKVTGYLGFTCAMKNLVGLLPGMIYGWAKSDGFPPHSGNPGIPNHYPERYDKLVVDLTSVSRINLVVVDAIVGMERARVQAWGGHPRRLNTIVAGADPVAVDAVCTRLVGYNPDDFEFLTLAERLGLGTADLQRIDLAGQPLDQVETRFVKAWDDPDAHYGQSNRTWLVRGPVALADSARLRPDPAQTPVTPGAPGWSPPLYFDSDRLSLHEVFDRQLEAMAWAYAECVAPQAQAAELWVGSSEGLAVWLNGQPVYAYDGSRTHRLPCDRVPVQLARGRNVLLVQVTQHHRDFDFSLNICEPETDERFSGTRVAGLRFATPGSQAAIPATAYRSQGAP